MDLWTVTCRPLRDLFVRIHDLVLLHVLAKALDVFLFAEVADSGVGERVLDCVVVYWACVVTCCTSDRG